ncbi:hypothetical protein BDN72DRAFT_947444 [Pluteus cervinus]|uniref:Uncharacterized protein n=1 Tax=Pluteus cervinus TaxID=181527 RepID=A0ACD3A114_9AGAR|nr:hypothetical protein BDN72DRAFT_947444 [Pluteus cervinus]
MSGDLMSELVLGLTYLEGYWRVLQVPRRPPQRRLSSSLLPLFQQPYGDMTRKLALIGPVESFTATPNAGPRLHPHHQRPPEERFHLFRNAYMGAFQHQRPPPPALFEHPGLKTDSHWRVVFGCRLLVFWPVEAFLTPSTPVLSNKSVMPYSRETGRHRWTGGYGGYKRVKQQRKKDRTTMSNPWSKQRFRLPPSPLQASTQANITFGALSPNSTATATPTRKRSHAGEDKENDYLPQLPSPKRPRCSEPAGTPRKWEDAKKLEHIMNAISEVGWGLGEFMWRLFCSKDDSGKAVSPRIIGEWFTTSYATVSSAGDDMYSLTTPYSDLRNVRAALSSFAVQVVHDRLLKEARTAVDPASGLHASLRKRAHSSVGWVDIGSVTVDQVANIIQQHQPLTWAFVSSIAGLGKEEDIEASRGEQHPTFVVATHASSMMNFTRNREARLLPLARGLYYFAHTVPVDVMEYSSRVGEIPAYNTIRHVLEELSSAEAAHWVATHVLSNLWLRFCKSHLHYHLVLGNITIIVPKSSGSK